MVTFTISGKAYDTACSPNASAVPAEEGWPEPEARRVGRGHQYRYTCAEETAALIKSHLINVGDIRLTCCPEPDERAEGRECLRAAANIPVETLPAFESILSGWLADR